MSYRKISCYRKISWSLEAARLDVIMIVSFWNLTGISGAFFFSHHTLSKACHPSHRARPWRQKFKICQIVSFCFSIFNLIGRIPQIWHNEISLLNIFWTNYILVILIPIRFWCHFTFWSGSNFESVNIILTIIHMMGMSPKLEIWILFTF